MKDRIEAFFKFRDNNTNFKTESLAGLTTFLAMAYILAVIPFILSKSGMDPRGAYAATALSACFGTILMGLTSNYPFAVAPGAGISTFFTYTVVLKMGFTWEQALAAAFIEGILFTLISLTPLREIAFDKFPKDLRAAITVGIGFYIAASGFINAGMITSDENTIVSFFNFSAQTSFSEGLSVFLSLLGLIITAVLYSKGRSIGFLIGMLFTWLSGVLCQLIGLYKPDALLSLPSLIPDLSQGLSMPDIRPVFMAFDFSKVLTFDFFIVVIAFLYMDFFETMGALIGCSLRGGFLRDEERLPRIKWVFLTDAISTIAAAVLGAPMTTINVESAIGIAEHGRTGFACLITALLFFLSLFLAPFFMAIPPFATAPALIVIGFYMIQQVRSIRFNRPLYGIPAFLTIAVMILTNSIADGMGFGIISYCILSVFLNNRKNISPGLWVLCLIFILRYALF